MRYQYIFKAIHYSREIFFSSVLKFLVRFALHPLLRRYEKSRKKFNICPFSTHNKFSFKVFHVFIYLDGEQKMKNATLCLFMGWVKFLLGKIFSDLPCNVSPYAFIFFLVEYFLMFFLYLLLLLKAKFLLN